MENVSTFRPVSSSPPSLGNEGVACHHAYHVDPSSATSFSSSMFHPPASPSSCNRMKVKKGSSLSSASSPPTVEGCHHTEKSPDVTSTVWVAPSSSSPTGMECTYTRDDVPASSSSLQQTEEDTDCSSHLSSSICSSPTLPSTTTTRAAFPASDEKKSSSEESVSLPNKGRDPCVRLCGDPSSFMGREGSPSQVASSEESLLLSDKREDQPYADDKEERHQNGSRPNSSNERLLDEKNREGEQRCSDRSHRNMPSSSPEAAEELRRQGMNEEEQEEKEHEGADLMNVTLPSEEEESPRQQTNDSPGVKKPDDEGSIPTQTSSLSRRGVRTSPRHRNVGSHPLITHSTASNPSPFSSSLVGRNQTSNIERKRSSPTSSITSAPMRSVRSSASSLSSSQVRFVSSPSSLIKRKSSSGERQASLPSLKKNLATGSFEEDQEVARDKREEEKEAHHLDGPQKSASLPKTTMRNPQVSTSSPGRSLREEKFSVKRREDIQDTFVRKNSPNRKREGVNPRKVTSPSVTKPGADVKDHHSNCSSSSSASTGGIEQLPEKIGIGREEETDQQKEEMKKKKAHPPLLVSSQIDEKSQKGSVGEVQEVSSVLGRDEEEGKKKKKEEEQKRIVVVGAMSQENEGRSCVDPHGKYRGTSTVNPNISTPTIASDVGGMGVMHVPPYYSSSSITNASKRREDLDSRGLRDKPVWWRELIKRHVEGDGNCMFRAFSDQLYGTQDYHLYIRWMAVEVMRIRRRDFEPFIDEADGPNFDAYLSKINTPGEWADDRELRALSMLYDVSIEIYDDEFHVRKTFYEEEEQQRRTPDEKMKRLCVSLIWSEAPGHYSSVYRQSKPFPLSQNKPLGTLECEGLRHLLELEEHQQAAELAQQHQPPPVDSAEEKRLAAEWGLDPKEFRTLVAQQAQLFAEAARAERQKNSPLKKAEDICKRVLQAFEDVKKATAISTTTTTTTHQTATGVSSSSTASTGVGRGTVGGVSGGGGHHALMVMNHHSQGLPVGGGFLPVGTPYRCNGGLYGSSPLAPPSSRLAYSYAPSSTSTTSHQPPAVMTMHRSAGGSSVYTPHSSLSSSWNAGRGNSPHQVTYMLPTGGPALTIDGSSYHHSSPFISSQQASELGGWRAIPSSSSPISSPPPPPSIIHKPGSNGVGGGACASPSSLHHSSRGGDVIEGREASSPNLHGGGGSTGRGVLPPSHDSKPGGLEAYLREQERLKHEYEMQQKSKLLFSHSSDGRTPRVHLDKGARDGWRDVEGRGNGQQLRKEEEVKEAKEQKRTPSSHESPSSSGVTSLNDRSSDGSLNKSFSTKEKGGDMPALGEEEDKRKGMLSVIMEHSGGIGESRQSSSSSISSRYPSQYLHVHSPSSRQVSVASTTASGASISPSPIATSKQQQQKLFLKGSFPSSVQSSSSSSSWSSHSMRSTNSKARPLPLSPSTTLFPPPPASSSSHLSSSTLLPLEDPFGSHSSGEDGRSASFSSSSQPVTPGEEEDEENRRRGMNLLSGGQKGVDEMDRKTVGSDRDKKATMSSGAGGEGGREEEKGKEVLPLGQAMKEDKKHEMNECGEGIALDRLKEGEEAAQTKDGGEDGIACIKQLLEENHDNEGVSFSPSPLPSDQTFRKNERESDLDSSTVTRNLGGKEGLAGMKSEKKKTTVSPHSSSSSSTSMGGDRKEEPHVLFSTQIGETNQGSHSPHSRDMAISPSLSSPSSVNRPSRSFYTSTTSKGNYIPIPPGTSTPLFPRHSHPAAPKSAVKPFPPPTSLSSSSSSSTDSITTASPPTMETPGSHQVASSSSHSSDASSSLGKASSSTASSDHSHTIRTSGSQDTHQDSRRARETSTTSGKGHTGFSPFVQETTYSFSHKPPTSYPPQYPPHCLITPASSTACNATTTANPHSHASYPNPPSTSRSSRQSSVSLREEAGTYLLSSRSSSHVSSRQGSSMVAPSTGNSIIAGGLHPDQLVRKSSTSSSGSSHHSSLNDGEKGKVMMLPGGVPGKVLPPVHTPPGGSDQHLSSSRMITPSHYIKTSEGGYAFIDPCCSSNSSTYKLMTPATSGASSMAGGSLKTTTGSSSSYLAATGGAYHHHPPPLPPSFVFNPHSFLAEPPRPAVLKRDPDTSAIKGEAGGGMGLLSPSAGRRSTPLGGVGGMTNSLATRATAAASPVTGTSAATATPVGGGGWLTGWLSGGGGSNGA
ncbi:otu-like cysteine protease domain-containing [Cystoisospora suis]|uniref:Otu-like cysteine protease domain-containing n=1 Tax=Cystoisospora suis TaxID=483139 RepID=A0A2C6LFY4_9APIC|nr:otu-like cysteine protease domain-containing [Cystoisospora suis]